MQAVLYRDDLPRVRAMVARISRELLDAAGGKMDAVADYCRLVPATLVQEYFGLIPVLRSHWKWSDNEYNQSKHMQETFRALIAEMGGQVFNPMPTKEQDLPR